MTTTPLHTRADRADAAFTEAVLAEWRDWRAYLTAQQTLLDARRAEQHDPFELGSSDLAEQDAQQTLQRLPAGRRALFQQEHTRRREQVALELDAERRLHGIRGQTDPDEVDARTLALLLDECEGRRAEDGRGLVPRPDDTYWELDVRDLLDTPVGAYTLSGPASGSQKLLRIGAMVALVAVVGAGLWFVFLRGGDAAPLPVAAADLAINGEAATPLPLRAVRLGTDPAAPAQTLRPVPHPTPFPPPDAAAAVRADAAFPPLICLDGRTLEGAQEVVLLGSGDDPQRHYTLRPAGDLTGADLVVQPCNGPGSARAGVFQDMLPRPDHPVGAAVDLPQQDGSVLSVTVQSVDLVGHGHDLTLPEDGARVRVTVTADQTVDWPTLQPRLRLQTGALVLPAATDAVPTGGVQFRFLIDAPTSPLDAMFLLSSGDTVTRWRTTLTPPPTRLAVLRTGLRVRDVQAAPTHAADGGRVPLAVTLTLHNTLAVPLLLAASDARLTQADTPLPLPDLPDLREPLAPDEQRTLTLPLDADPATPLTLTIGGQRFVFTVITE